MTLNVNYFADPTRHKSRLASSSSNSISNRINMLVIFENLAMRGYLNLGFRLKELLPNGVNAEIKLHLRSICATQN